MSVYLVERKPDVFDTVRATRMDILGSGALVFTDDRTVFPNGDLAYKDGNHISQLTVAFASGQWISVVEEEWQS